MSERLITGSLQLQITRFFQIVADARFWHDYWLEQATLEHQRSLHDIDTWYNRALAENVQAFNSVLPSLNDKAEAITNSARVLFPPWDDPRWESWTPAKSNDDIESLTRIGELTVKGYDHCITLPALLYFPGDRSILFKAAGSTKDTAVQAVQSLLLRLLATLPPGKLRFLLIDPVGLGQNVAPFMHLADYDEALVTGKAWTEPQHIEQRLADLTEQMENVIQKYLRNQFATIEDYNAQAGEVAEPYRVLVVLNFPVNFTDTAARRLVSIAANGPRCGVYALITVDTQQPLPYGFDLADLERTATVIAWDGRRFVWQDEDFQDCLLELDGAPPAALFD
ncbi:MAG: cell division protein FtsK, partial [Chloroflexi bacterium]|nr:cell division protein FtsK [Chloroflexota bacterium]